MKRLLCAALLLFSSTSFAQYGSTYGTGYNGNTYNSTGSGYTGYNGNTGSTWNAHSYGGTTSGTDKKGNNWDYNSSSGTYNNYGTGKTCTGHGVNRVCNK